MSRQLRPRGSNRIRYDNKAGPYGINHLSQASQPEGPAYQENRPPGDAVEVTSGNVSDSTFNEAEDIASIESEGVSEGEMAKAKERLEYMGDEYFAGSDAEDDLSSDVDELQSEDGYIGVPAKRMAKGGPRNAKDTAKKIRPASSEHQDQAVRKQTVQSCITKFLNPQLKDVPKPKSTSVRRPIVITDSSDGGAISQQQVKSNDNKSQGAKTGERKAQEATTRTSGSARNEKNLAQPTHHSSKLYRPTKKEKEIHGNYAFLPASEPRPKWSEVPGAHLYVAEDDHTATLVIDGDGNYAMQVLPGDPFGLGGDGLGLDADRETSFVGAVLIPMKTALEAPQALIQFRGLSIA